MRANTESDFYRHVEPIPMAGCWIWIGKNSGPRYGGFNLRGRVIKAHRFSYELHRGPIAEGLCVLHKCDVGFCVNPDHLFLGSQLDNARDREQKGRGNQPRGERAAHTHLTSADVVAIRAKHAGGARQVDIAAEYRVAQTTISRIVLRKVWGHVQ